MNVISGDVIGAVFLLLFIGAVVLCLVWEGRAGISPAPTLPWVRRNIITLLEKHTDKTRIRRIAELGCGWGGLSFRLARAFPRASVTGYEISPVPFAVSRLRAILNPRVTIKCCDFMAEDLSGYDAIVCYLSDRHMAALKPRLDALAAGTIIVSNAFAIPGRTPDDRAASTFGVRIPVYLYINR